QGIRFVLAVGVKEEVFRRRHEDGVLLADGLFRRRRAWRSWRIWRNRTWSSPERGSQREEERSDYYSMVNPLKPAIWLHHVADCSRAKSCTQTLERGVTTEKATVCIAIVACDDS